MTSFLPLIVVYSFIVLWLLSLTYFFRHYLSSMVGMMNAMALGMMVGLGVGTAIGLTYPHQFFESTVISMLAGAFIGTIAGTPVSLLALLDGLMSGLMGGMMGAMVGVMLPAHSYEPFLKIMGVFSAGLFFILFLTLQKEIVLKGNESNLTKWLFHKPQPIFVLIGLFLLLVHWLQLS